MVASVGQPFHRILLNNMSSSQYSLVNWQKGCTKNLSARVLEKLKTKEIEVD